MTPAGIYTASIKAWGLSEAKTGTPQVFFKFEFQSEGKVYERTIFRAMTEAAADYTIGDLRALGYPLDTFDELDPSHPKAHSFAGQEVAVECIHGNYNGREREEWRFAFGGGGFTPKPIKSVSRLNDLFGSKLKQAAKQEPRKPPPAGPGSEKAPF